MNIKEAKIQIQNAMTAYFTKDQFGNYIIPTAQQRPVFLMGPPGVGKTAIMEQIAAELGVGLISYSMTHHTRQSALGLPFIVSKIYGGKEYSVSEYTMSEIIASVYNLMEDTGVKEGILFLDEINCVSETLAPSILQFLQYKIFGRHRVPEGWIVVTAGNPLEYNNSAREFDIVTWDRLKRIDVEPDFEVWKEYAYQKLIHPAVITYLEIKTPDFYIVESTIDGKCFVTARGWEDLSQMIQLYEQHNLKVDENLIGQYLQNQKIAKSFAIYYDLFNKYRSDYQIDKILLGKADESIKKRARTAKFDERLSLLGLLLYAVTESVRSECLMEAALMQLTRSLRSLLVEMTKPGADYLGLMEKQVIVQQEMLDNGRQSFSMGREDQLTFRSLISVLKEQTDFLVKEQPADSKVAAALLKKDFDRRIVELRKLAKNAQEKLSNLFSFCDEVFSADSQELLILVTELTINTFCVRFIGRYGCPEYFAHNKALLFYERQQEIIQQIGEIDLSLE